MSFKQSGKAPGFGLKYNPSIKKYGKPGGLKPRRRPRCYKVVVISDQVISTVGLRRVVSGLGRLQGVNRIQLTTRPVVINERIPLAVWNTQMQYHYGYILVSGEGGATTQLLERELQRRFRDRARVVSAELVSTDLCRRMREYFRDAVAANATATYQGPGVLHF